ncbi:2-octaprenyl-3-methyl-6-methoxy-1,4-benzoquinol hydroxylase [Roseivivax jejudonensis]|uniref:2-octaprenyl-3-methyl-6-methoxy-1,4-benzoquinol hydroxylase n=1 Tax=Roseivivax jejudonensis TaxID=1529041 RepID=A0A1X6YFU0_9RHOB|nr:FAD-dependent monooxygenase [Roseivivax jejudonensis]SLN19334.1 2-octaprenyl-3-methyl-6-methoxy-1,4-benzoquinol hydroxylase [Roseivivax jejudonensis]
MDNAGGTVIFAAMTFDTDIAIVGGGLNGLALALAVARAPLSVTVIDAGSRADQAAPGFDGRSYAMANATIRLLAALEVWERLAPEAQPIHEIKVSDGRVADGAALLGLHFSSAEIEEGPMGHMVEDRHLRPALLDAVDATHRITHLTGETVTGQRTDAHGATLTLASGQDIRARLAVAADGRQSRTAARAGIGRTGWSYGQTALVCAIAHEHPHGGVAHQLFLPAGPLAILPLAGNRSSIVWTERTGLAEEIGALPEADYLTVLRPRFGDFLGRLELAGARYTYPLSLSLANGFVAERLALVGDAAHGVHPIAGQGLNAGLRDVAALAQVVHEARRRGEDIGAAPVLDRYARWRRFDTAALATATDVFNRLFSTDAPGLRALRDIGMQAVQSVPTLRRAFIREAAGLTGDLPDLMR